MQDLNDKVTGNNLTAAEWNEVPSEIQNVIEGLGIVLSGADLNQLGKGIAGYAANGDYYTDSGAANAYVLTKIGIKQSPPAYTDGFSAVFRAGNANTGASTVNVAGLGVKGIKTPAGAALASGNIKANATVELRFDSANDWFEILSIVAAPDVPVGGSIAWNTATPPSGYLEEDGSAISRTTYADLFAIIGTTFGVGDGSTTFNLDDKRGNFLRGWDNGRGVDPDAAGRTDRGDGTTGDNIGTKQDHQLDSHLHDITAPSYWGTGPLAGSPHAFWASENVSVGNASRNSSNTGGNETRPRNTNVMFCMKY